MTAQHFLTTATLLPNGKVLVAGGEEGQWRTYKQRGVADPSIGDLERDWLNDDSAATAHSRPATQWESPGRWWTQRLPRHTRSCMIHRQGLGARQAP